ncbi:hypothetical protein [Cohnella hongkongensis]|uniref:ABC transporter permease n=1 Tax=Cohnella hongkongensis TaxID=178337 RepID=A0ABV9FM01_9BACL
MIGLMRFAFKDYVRSYRYVAPMICYALVLGFIYGVAPNPVMPSYSLTASFMFVVSVWLAFGYVDAERETQQIVGVLHAGNLYKYYLGRALPLVLIVAALSLATTVYPILLARFDRQPGAGEMLAAYVAHLGLSLLGMALSYLFTNKLVRKLSEAVIGLILVVAVSLAGGGIREALPDSVRFLASLLPPVFPLIDALNEYHDFRPMDKAIVLLAPYGYSAVLFCIFLRLMGKRKF